MSDSDKIIRFLQRPTTVWAVLAVLTAIALAASGHLVHQREQTRAETSARETAHTYDLLTRNILADIERLIGGAAVDYLQGRSDERARLAELILHRHKESNPFILDLLILDADGDIAVWTGDGDHPVVRERNFYRRHLERPDGDIHVAPPGPSCIREEVWCFSISRAVRGPGGELLGVGVGVIDIAAVQGYFSDLLAGGDLSVTVIHQERSLVLRAPPMPSVAGEDVVHLVEGGLPLGAPIVREVAAGRDQGPRIVSFQPLPGYDLIVAGSVGLDGVREISRRYVAAALVIWFALALPGLWGARRLEARLRADEERREEFTARLKNLTRNLPGFVYQLRLDPDGAMHYIYASEGVTALFGVTPAQAVASAGTLLGMIHPDDYDRVIEESMASAREGANWRGIFRMNRLDGRTLWIEARDTPQIEEDGGILWTGYVNDITEVKELEEALHKSEATFRAFVEHANEIIYTASPDGVLTYVSPNWTERLGHQVREVVGRRIADFVHPDDLQSCLDYLERVLAGDAKQGGIEYRVRHADGGWRWHVSNGAPLRDDEGDVYAYLGVAHDITGRKEAEELITHMAHHDLLTDLPNRKLFFEMAQRAVGAARRQGGRLALLFVDLDRFKPVNDTHGHAVGDLLLKDVARRMTGALREADLVGRIGGDEFVVLLHAVDDSGDALVAADKIRNEMNRPFEIQGHTLDISCSIGIAVYPDHGEEVDELARNADAAMYRAKEAGRDRAIFFEHGMAAE